MLFAIVALNSKGLKAMSSIHFRSELFIYLLKLLINGNVELQKPTQLYSNTYSISAEENKIKRLLCMYIIMNTCSLDVLFKMF